MAGITYTSSQIHSMVSHNQLYNTVIEALEGNEMGLSQVDVKKKIDEARFLVAAASKKYLSYRYKILGSFLVGSRFHRCVKATNALRSCLLDTNSEMAQRNFRSALNDYITSVSQKKGYNNKLAKFLLHLDTAKTVALTVNESVPPAIPDAACHKEILNSQSGSEHRRLRELYPRSRIANLRTEKTIDSEQVSYTTQRKTHWFKDGAVLSRNG